MIDRAEVIEVLTCYYIQYREGVTIAQIAELSLCEVRDVEFFLPHLLVEGSIAFNERTQTLAPSAWLLAKLLANRTKFGMPTRSEVSAAAKDWNWPTEPLPKLPLTS
jgi:hypothetical protein